MIRCIMLKYGLSLALIVSLVLIYGNMWDFIPKRMNFIYHDFEIGGRLYFYKLGHRLSFCVIFFVIFIISRDNIKWTAFLLTLYWIEDSIEFVLWYNTTPKWHHWYFICGLWTIGTLYNEVTRIKRESKQVRYSGDHNRERYAKK